jgi:hypothetical protein
VAAQRVHALAIEAAALGHDVTVLTTSKRSDQTSRPAASPGVSVIEVPYRAWGPFERLRELDRPRSSVSASSSASGQARAGGLKSAVLSFARKLKARTGIFGSLRMPDLTDAWVTPAVAWARTQSTWDVVVSSAGPYTAHLVALQLRQTGLARRWCADFRDLWTQNHMASGLFPFTIYERVLERRVLAHADLLTTVSQPLATSLASMTRCPVEIVFNGYAHGASEGLTTAIASDGEIRLVYTGTLYPQGQDVGPLLDGLAILNQHEPATFARVRLIVAGNAPEYWHDQAAKRGVSSSLQHLGLVSAAESHRLQQSAHGLIIFEWTTPGLGVLTGKVFEYLAAHAPILVVGGPCDDAVAQLVSQARRGVSTGRDATAVAAAIRRLAQGQPLCNGERNRALIESYSRQRQSQRWLELLDNELRREPGVP